MSNTPKQNPPLLTQRKQMFFVGFIVWVLLLCWSLSAFWGHIDSLKEEYASAAKAGAAAAEFIVLAFLWWHCFHKKIGVRKWTLIFCSVLAVVIVVHSGAVRGLRA